MYVIIPFIECLGKGGFFHMLGSAGWSPEMMKRVGAMKRLVYIADFLKLTFESTAYLWCSFQIFLKWSNCPKNDSRSCDWWFCEDNGTCWQQHQLWSKWSGNCSWETLWTCGFQLGMALAAWGFPIKSQVVAIQWGNLKVKFMVTIRWEDILLMVRSNSGEKTTFLDGAKAKTW